MRRGVRTGFALLLLIVPASGLTQQGLGLEDVGDDPWLCHPPPAYWEDVWIELDDDRVVAVREHRLARADRMLERSPAVRLDARQLDDLAEDWRMIEQGRRAYLVRGLALDRAQGDFAVYRNSADASLVVDFLCRRRCRAGIVHRPLIVFLEGPPPSVCPRYEIGTLGD